MHPSRKVDIRLHGKGDSNSHGARPVHQKHRWTRTIRLSIKNSLSVHLQEGGCGMSFVCTIGVKVECTVDLGIFPVVDIA